MSTASPASAERLALSAWQELSPEAPEPRRIETLKDVGFPLEGCVHRLHGVGPKGGDVIAKRTELSKATVERAVYEHVLPALPLRAAAYYGAVPEPDTGFCWLFLEDVRGEPVSMENRLVAEWLARLHATASALPRPAELPSKGFAYYLEIVQTSRKHIADSLGGDELDAVQRDWLTAALAVFEDAEAVWADLTELCAGFPETFVHGDVAAKNLVLDPAGRIVGFDWASAGWGAPAVDLRHVDASHYCSGVSARWPGLSVRAIEGAATAGHVLWCIARMRGVSEGLPAQPSIRKLKHWRRRLAEALHAAGPLLADAEVAS